jgi:hypothetical protein
MTLQEKLAELIPQWREERVKLIKEKGSVVLTEATVAMAFGGMRGVKGMVCDTSLVEPDTGLIIRAGRGSASSIIGPAPVPASPTGHVRSSSSASPRRDASSGACAASTGGSRATAPPAPDSRTSAP